MNRRFRRAYVVALSLITACSVASFAFLHASIASMSSDAAVMNVAGRQAALAERAALMIDAVAGAGNGSERLQALAELEGAADELARAHRALIDGDPALNLPGAPSARVEALYFDAPVNVDGVLSIFLGGVSRIANMARAGEVDRSVARTVARLARGTLADGFDRVVAQYQAEADQRLARSKTIHLVILMAMLSLLAIEARFIFLPAARQIEMKTRELLRSRADLDQAATHDALTGLANRRRCQETLSQAIADVDEHGGTAAVLHIDLDGFKTVNDTLGHGAGDAVLWQVAERLRRAARADDVVARVGGDEFVIICPGRERDWDPDRIAERIFAEFAEPFVLVNEVRVDVGCSIGISRYPSDADGADDLLVAADLALYRAKEGGRNRRVLFDRSMREEFHRKIELARRVKQAIVDGEFELFYQPQIEMVTGRVVEVESLLRWRDPEKGLRAPDEFLDIIERSGGMARLGAFVMDRAVADAAGWYRAGIEFGRIAINISAAQLRDTDFIDALLDRLFAHGLPPDKVAIEIVESAFITGHSRRLRALLDELNDLEINVEFDDFGTGYASLTHLRQLPVNRIKIDRSFICDLPGSTDHSNIVQGVIKIVQRLGLDIVAEGVETVAQARALNRWGCRVAQGFLFARPAPLAETTAYLKLAPHKRVLADLGPGDRAMANEADPRHRAAS